MHLLDKFLMVVPFIKNFISSFVGNMIIKVTNRTNMKTIHCITWVGINNIILILINLYIIRTGIISTLGD
ncbi:hypothetical protein D1646_02025 [Pseudoflavonifractor sp. 60]|nr:hypothetical protein [Pseudoflavonifractor sp. 60]